MKSKNSGKPMRRKTRFYVYPTSDNLSKAISEALGSGKFGSFSEETQEIIYQGESFPGFEIPRLLAIHLAEGEHKDQCKFLTRSSSGEYRKWSLRKKKEVIKKKVGVVLISVGAVPLHERKTHTAF